MDLRPIARQLEPAAPGVWRTPACREVSYPDDGNDACFAVEDHSFWFRHRNELIRAAFERHVPRGGWVLDAGGGNGFVARALQQDGYEVVLVEPGASGVRHAHERGVRHVVHGIVEDAGFLPGTFSAAGAFDVVEHIEDDRAFLAGVRPLLAPDGVLILTVPAYPALWSAEDVHAGHHRRYTPDSLRRALADAGFDTIALEPCFAALVFPVLLLRCLPTWLGLASASAGSAPRDHGVSRGWTARVLDACLRRELDRIRSGRAPRLGTSLLAVAAPRPAPHSRS